VLRRAISDSDLHRVRVEIAERVKDMVVASSRSTVARVLTRERVETLLRSDSGSALVVTFDLHFCAGDVQQILARGWRERGKI
jgi:hypothetical protein